MKGWKVAPRVNLRPARVAVGPDGLHLGRALRGHFRAADDGIKPRITVGLVRLKTSRPLFTMGLAPSRLPLARYCRVAACRR